MRFRFFGRPRRVPTLLALTIIAGAVGVGVARASDHQDNPLVELKPSMDMSDVYAFPGASADRVVLAIGADPE